MSTLLVQTEPWRDNMKTLKEFEDALNRIVAPVLEEPWDDDEGTDDDNDADTGYARESMFIQLGRILDSQGNPKPVESVVTDDGDHIEVSPMEAKVLKMMATTDKVKPAIRQEFLNDIQTTKGLSYFLDGRPQEMTQKFVDKYIKKAF